MRWLRSGAGVVFAFAALGERGATQQQREALRLSFQLTPQADVGHTSVSVRIYNVSDHTVNVWTPDGLWCRSAPGAVYLEWQYKATDSSGINQTRVVSNCGGGAAATDEGKLGERIAKQKRTWMTLRPGQYAQVVDSVNTADVAGQPGVYAVRAVYRSPAFSADEKRGLRGAGIETPGGVYKSEGIEFAVR